MRNSGEKYLSAKAANLSREEFEQIEDQVTALRNDLIAKHTKISEAQDHWKNMTWINFFRFVGSIYPFFTEGVLKFSNLEQYTSEERTRFFIDLWMHNIGSKKLSQMEKLPYWPDLYTQVFNHPYIFNDSGAVDSYWIRMDSESAWWERTEHDNYSNGGGGFTEEEWCDLQIKILQLGEKGANLRALFLENCAKTILFDIYSNQTIHSKEAAQRQIERIEFFKKPPQWNEEKTTVSLKYAREFWSEYLIFVSRYKENERIMRSYLEDQTGLVAELKRIKGAFPEMETKQFSPDIAAFLAWSVTQDVNENCIKYLKTLCNQRVLKPETLCIPWTWIVAAKQMQDQNLKISMQRLTKRNNENEKLQKSRKGIKMKKRVQRGEMADYSAASIMKGISKRQEEHKQNEMQDVDFLLDEELLAAHTNALNFALYIDTRENAERVLNLYFYLMDELSKLLLVPSADDFLSLTAQFQVMMIGNESLIKWYESFDVSKTDVEVVP